MNFLNLKLAIKNLFNTKTSSLISIIGLSIAFVSFFYIYSYVSFELSYDSQNKKADRIYRISGDIIAVENTMTHGVLGSLMGPSLKEDFPAVEAYARLQPIHRTITLETREGKYDVDEAYSADHSIFDIFTLDFIYGDRKTALANPNEIVINQSLSHKFFGNKDPVGETIMKGKQLLTVAGVVKDSPRNAHHKLNVLFSVSEILTNPDLTGVPPVRISEGYWMPSVFTFILLKQGAEIESITDNFEPFFNKYMAEFGKAINAKFRPVAIPLKDLHFSRHMSYDYPKGKKIYIYMLILIMAFILFTAIINYSNLLIAQNLGLSKNIGIRKIAGASRSSLYSQFLLNVLVFLFAVILLTFLLFVFSRPYLIQLASHGSTTISISEIIVLSIIMVIIVGLILSLVPYLGQTTRKGLSLMLQKQSNQVKPGKAKFGRTSTIIQYTLSTLLIMTALIISRQLEFIENSNMGFNKENVLLLKLADPETRLQDIQSFREEILNNPLITDVSFSTNVPGDVMGSFHFLVNRSGQKVTKIVNSMGIGYNYIPLMDMKLKEGRNFDIRFNDDSYKSVIINEALLTFCGFNDSILGTQLDGATVVGVLKDVCFNSLHNPTEPMLFYLSQGPRGYLNIRLNSTNPQDGLKAVKAAWKTSFNDNPMEVQFLDNRVAMMYAEDRRIDTLIKLFTMISLIISMMGLFNLSSLISKRKIKEIGIRKVNGAKVSEILAMLNKDFVKWVVIAFVIATPIAWYAMHKWLENFAYKTTLSWWIFALAGVLALGIALLTVSWQSWRAATRNPVDALRYE